MNRLPFANRILGRIPLGFLTLTLLVLFCLSRYASPSKASAPNTPVKLYIYPETAIYGRNYLVSAIEPYVQAGHITHIQYDSIYLEPDGNCALFDTYAADEIVGSGNYTQAGSLRQLAALRDNYPTQLQILLSMGGWSFSENFSDVTKDPTKLAKMAQTCVDLMTSYRFDGLEINWDYPGGGGSSAAPFDAINDAANYTNLLRTLRQALDAKTATTGQSYLLTAGVGAGEDKQHHINSAEIVPYVDWIHVETYGFNTTRQTMPAHHANLYQSSYDPRTGDPSAEMENYNVDYSLQLYINGGTNKMGETVMGGVPRSKLVMGIPFFGRSWTNVPNTQLAPGLPGLYTTSNIGTLSWVGACECRPDFANMPSPMWSLDTSTLQDGIGNASGGSWEESVFEYRDISRLLTTGGYTRYWDSEAMAPYLYNPNVAGGTLITYDDEQSIQFKIDYIKNNCLAGSAVSDLTQDRGTTLFAKITNGLNNYDPANCQIITPTPIIPTPTNTHTPTPTKTNTPTPTPTPTIPSHAGDSFESDDSCGLAKDSVTDGTEQTRTFHDAGDTDWIKFDGTETNYYQIIGDVDPNSPVDLSLEVYGQCNDPVLQRPRQSFGVGARLLFAPPTSGTYYIKLTDNNRSTFGDNATYRLSVRAIEMIPSGRSAVIIIAGRRNNRDSLQRNIYNVTNNVYRMYREQGFPDEHIMYLATDPNLDPRPRSAGPYVDDAPTNANVKNAITSWAKQYVSDTQALTIYLMSHGDDNKFYLDNTQLEILSPSDLNDWLSELESAVPGVKINVIIDACLSGSFIDLPESISKEGRVVISSAESDKNAWATLNGADFSDLFIDYLREGRSVEQSFRRTKRELWRQKPWIDSNGNNIPNEDEDYDIASRRGFGFPGSFPDDPAASAEVWKPYIAEPTPMNDTHGTATLSVTVQNDNLEDQITEVIGVIYPPSYTMPITPSELVDISMLPTVTLHSAGDDIYTATITVTQRGKYEVVIYAKDSSELVSQPRLIEFTNIGLPTAVQTQEVGTTRIDATVMALLIVVGLGGASAVLLSNRRRA